MNKFGRVYLLIKNVVHALGGEWEWVYRLVTGCGA